MENHVGEPVADMDRWQPRLGVSWDITGESRHVVRASWGRFMDPTALSIPGFASGVVSFYNEYVTAEHWCNRLHLECTADDIAFLESVLGESWTYAAPDGTEYVLWLNPEAAAVDEPAWTLDQARRATGDDRYGSLAAPYADELIVAYEAQVAPSTSIELSYVNKRTDEIIEDTCINNEWAFDDSVPPPSLDDPSTWTSAAGCSRWLISNPPGFYRTYEAWIGKLETRRQNLHLMASYTWAESWGTTPNGAIDSYATGLADFYPLNSVNQAGWMPGDRRHRVRLSGYWLLPHDITLGFEGWWSSAYAITVGSSCSNLDNAPAEVVAFYGYDRDALLPYCTTSDEVFLGSHWISLEPRGATRTKPAGSLDLQVSKGITFGGVRVEGILSVLNVLGRELDDSFNSVAYRVTTEEYGEPVYDEETGELIDYYMPIGQPLGWHAPRRYELGFRVEF